MTHIIQRHDQSDVWFSANPVLQEGEVGWETDTRLSKIGDGVTPWNALSYTMANISVDKVDLGLDQVDNTSDVDKPVSSATATALANALASVAATYATKAESTAGLALKAPLASPALTGNPTAPTPALADDDTSIATTAFVKDVVADRLDTDTFWYGSAALEAASTVNGWVAMLNFPSATSTDDDNGDCYEPIGGGLRIKKVGKYIIEVGARVAGGAVNVRNGMGLGTTGGNSVPSGGTPSPGYSLMGVSVIDNYFTITRPFTVRVPSVDIKVWYYCQTTTSHQGQITNFNVMRVG